MDRSSGLAASRTCRTGRAVKAQRHRLAMQLFHDALAKGRDERESFLRQACGADDRLRAEVESLLANHQSRTILIRRAGSTGAASGSDADPHSTCPWTLALLDAGWPPQPANWLGCTHVGARGLRTWLLAGNWHRASSRGKSLRAIGRYLRCLRRFDPCAPNVLDCVWALSHIRGPRIHLGSFHSAAASRSGRRTETRTIHVGRADRRRGHGQSLQSQTCIPAQAYRNQGAR